MGRDRQYQNYLAKERAKKQHSSARWALEDFRKSGDPSGFPNLEIHILGSRRGLSLSGYGYEDVSPRLTQEEYDRFKVAYEASDEGKEERKRLDKLYADIETEE